MIYAAAELTFSAAHAHREVLARHGGFARRPVRASPWKLCCWAGAALGQHHHCMWGYVMAPLWLHYGSVVAAASATASAGAEAVLWPPCHPGETNCLQFLRLSASSSSLFACALPTLRPAGSKQDNWPHQQDQQYSRPPWVALHLAWLIASFSYTRLWSIYGEGHGTHSSALAWKIPRTEEPGGLRSMGSRRVGHGWATSPSLFTFMHWRRKWQPTPVFLPGESEGRGSLVGCHLWGRTEPDTTDST